MLLVPADFEYKCPNLDPLVEDSACASLWWHNVRWGPACCLVCSPLPCLATEQVFAVFLLQSLCQDLHLCSGWSMRVSKFTKSSWARVLFIRFIFIETYSQRIPSCKSYEWLSPQSNIFRSEPMWTRRGGQVWKGWLGQLLKPSCDTLPGIAQPGWKSNNPSWGPVTRCVVYCGNTGSQYR